MYRDIKSKQKLIEYLQQGTDERLFQAITNCFDIGYLGSATSPDGKNFKDLWHIEADRSFFPEEHNWGQLDGEEHDE